MTQDEKAARYEAIVAEGDRVQRELSQLKSANAAINTKSREYDTKVGELNGKLNRLKTEMEKLFANF